MDRSTTKQKLSRRDILKLVAPSGAALILAACGAQSPLGSVPTLGSPVSPTPEQFQQFLATLTPEARATLTRALATSTGVSTAAETQDLLEQLPVTTQAVSQVVQALTQAGIHSDAATLLRNGLQIRTVRLKDGNTVQAALLSLEDPKLGELAGQLPLLVKSALGWDQAHPKDFGTIATMYGSPYYPVEAREKIYANTVANYNVALIDRMAWHETGGQSADDWSLLDRGINEVKDAQQHGMKIWGVNLLDPLSNFTSTFLKNMKNASQEEITRIVTNHLTKIAETFKGQVEYYDVITEPTEGDNFSKLMGPEYLKTVFRTMKAADPKPKLILNDGRNMMSPGLNGTDYGQNTNFDKKMVDLLKAEELIDGIGIQMHLYADQPLDPTDMQKTIAAYGLPVYITEMDVDLRKAPKNYILQAQMYYQGIQLFLTSPASSGIICLWDGACGDRYSWYEKDGSLNSEPTPFNDDLSPKLSFYAILKAMWDANT